MKGFLACVEQKKLKMTLKNNIILAVLQIFGCLGCYAQSDSCSYIFNGKILDAYTLRPFGDVSQLSVFVTGYHCNVNSENRVIPISPDGSIAVDVKTYYWSLTFFKDVVNTSDISSFINNEDFEYLKKVVSDDPEIVNNPPSIIQMLAMDVNQDNKVDNNDVKLMRQRIRGQIKEFPLAKTMFGYPFFASSDWLFLDQALLESQLFQISSTFPHDDFRGYSRHFLPSWEARICLQLPISGDRSCPTIGNATYIGFLLGDVNGDVITSSQSARLRAESPTWLNEDNEFLPEINIFPNPAKDELHLVLPNSSVMAGSVQIFDLQGTMLLQRQFNEHSLVDSDLKIDISMLSDGVYFVCLKYNNQVVRMKFLRDGKRAK
jgi:hypothetical protein